MGFITRAVRDMATMFVDGPGWRHDLNGPETPLHIPGGGFLSDLNELFSFFPL